MAECASLRAGTPLDATCADCGHGVSFHRWPSRICNLDGLTTRVAELERLVELLMSRGA